MLGWPGFRADRRGARRGARLNTPLFSVVIPSWRRAQLVGRAVRSILDQKVRDLEVIVVSDGPDEATRRAVEALDDDRIVYISHSHSGVSAARNRGASEARGRFLTFLDSDDEALPGWLAGFETLLRRPNTGVACVGVEVRFEDDRAPEVVRPRPLGPVYEEMEGLFLAGSFALRRDLFAELGGFDEALAHSENTELALRLTALCRRRGLAIACDPEPRFRYHYQGTAGGEKGERRTRARLESARLLLERHGERLGRVPSLHASYWAIATVAAARLGRYREARRSALRAVAIRPSDPRHWGRLALCLAPRLGRRFWARPLVFLRDGR